MKKYFDSMISEDVEVGIARAVDCLQNYSPEKLEEFTHDYLDELMYNILYKWEGLGRRDLDLSRGRLNAYFIQVLHMGIMGSDLGVVPEWNIDNNWSRLQLFDIFLKESYSYYLKQHEDSWVHIVA
jgi:hypothetical protein